MHRYYCTYFDKNYLVRGMALITSLIEQEKEGITIYVVCLDEFTRAILNNINIPQVVLIPLHEIEHGDRDLLTARGNRNQVEYFWTMTPTIMLRVLERNPHIDILTYVDSDLYFFSSPEPIYNELGDASVLIHGHRFPKAFEHLEIHGIYNVGLLCFRNDTSGREVLKWWRARCNEWCYARVEDGKFGDQLYLNDWPERFSRVRVLQHLGAGVAPWNAIQYRIEAGTNGSITIDGYPLVFYHFHALNIISPQIFIPIKHDYFISESAIRCCYLPYVQLISKVMGYISSLAPSFETADRVFWAHADQPFLFDKAATPLLDGFIRNQTIVSVNETWKCSSCRLITNDQSLVTANE